jgi:hypothetical protein
MCVAELRYISGNGSLGSSGHYIVVETSQEGTPIIYDPLTDRFEIQGITVAIVVRKQSHITRKQDWKPGSPNPELQKEATSGGPRRMIPTPARRSKRSSTGTENVDFAPSQGSRSKVNKDSKPYALISLFDGTGSTAQPYLADT